MSDLKPVSCAEFSRRHGVSRKTTSLWLKRGLIVMDAGGGVDVEASDLNLARRPPVIRGGVTRGPNSARGNASEVIGNGVRKLREGLARARSTLHPNSKKHMA